MENLPIEWVHISGYDDGPVEGWVRAGGRYLHFRLDRDLDADVRNYRIDEVPGSSAPWTRLRLLKRCAKDWLLAISSVVAGRRSLLSSLIGAEDSRASERI